jgi:4-aminobutyrate aminotransferase/(S)-3-amino-2-methylpropionate transaminase
MPSWTELWTERREAHVPKGVGNVSPFFIAKAEGALITDVDGREFIDFAGGIGVLNVGHRHPKVVEAVKSQADEYLHSCFHVMMYQPYIELAEKLNRLIPCRGDAKTMFANSGAEAVENAVKIARHHTGRSGLIAFHNGFHGRTYLAMALTSKVMPYKSRLGAVNAPGIYRAHYPYCYRCPWGRTYPDCQLHCADAYFEQDFFKHFVDPSEVAAMVIEPVQGEGGFIHPPMEYLAGLRKICDRHGILLIMDEIQTGFGRTGAMFASEHYGVQGDIVTSAKSLAGGLPLSAVTGTAEIMDSVHPGGLGGTYGGNPLACQAALAVLEVMEEENLVAKSKALGDQVRSRLDSLAARFPIIGQVRGIGAMLAIELVKDQKTKEPAPELAKALVQYCLHNGLIILDCGTLANNVRMLMPLTITGEQLEKALSILDGGLQSLA